jgi:hypothetical protein
MTTDMFRDGPVAINLGIEAFADSIRATGRPVVHVTWKPPGGGEPDTAWKLALLAGDPDDPECPGSRVDRANAEAVRRLLSAEPVLVDVSTARAEWPDLDHTLLHAGPPVSWERMCGPMRGAVLGAILYEGWARSIEEAVALVERGAVRFEPCHHRGAVGPMAGVVSPSMPLWVVRNAAAGNVAYSTLNEGLGRVLRFGSYDAEVIGRLRWMSDVLAPGLKMVLRLTDGGIGLKPLIAQALQMGDDGHNRNVAATSLLFRRLARLLLTSSLERSTVAAILEFVDGNNHFFLNISMAACKACLDAAHGVPESSLVTAMSRNGVEFGIRVSGLGERWFTAPAPVPEGLYFPGFSADDANPDLGDSAITETAGLGGFAMAAAPAMVQFVGGAPEDAASWTQEMYLITVARNTAFPIPPLGFAGAPTGIDVRKVVDTGITPVINTGIAHREAGFGQVGAGIVRAPMACFVQALDALAETLGSV